MEQIKSMLLGIAIILITIVIHLFIVDSLLTDLIAIIGFIIVLVSYFSKDKNNS